MQTEECIAAALTANPVKPLIHVFVDQRSAPHLAAEVRAGLSCLGANLRLYSFWRSGMGGTHKKKSNPGFHVTRAWSMECDTRTRRSAEFLMAIEAGRIISSRAESGGSDRLRFLVLAGQNGPDAVCDLMRQNGALAFHAVTLAECAGAAVALQVGAVGASSGPSDDALEREVEYE